MVAIVVCECQAGGCSGWNIDEWSLRVALAHLVRPSGLERCVVSGWGGGTLLGCEAARGPPFVVGVCGWSPRSWMLVGACVVGVGLFLENCIVDASIL